MTHLSNRIPGFTSHVLEIYHLLHRFAFLLLVLLLKLPSFSFSGASVSLQWCGSDRFSVVVRINFGLPSSLRLHLVVRLLKELAEFMEKKHGFFSALEEAVRGLSPARLRTKSPAAKRNSSSGALLILPRLRKGQGEEWQPQQPLVQARAEAPMIERSSSFRPVGEALSPLMEGPDGDAPKEVGQQREGWGHWVRGQFSRTPSVTSSAAAAGCSFRTSDLRLLLGVMGAPLAPVHVSTVDPLPHLSIKDTSIVIQSSTLFFT